MSLTPSRDIFWQISQAGVQRLLSQMDRAPFSPAFGSWHRAYWHQRLSDFSSSACQQGILSLALLHSTSRDGNLFYKSPLLLNWIEASMNHLLRLQNEDGSFDEWYVNERGWAGPTGYLLYSLLHTWELLEGELSVQWRPRLQSAVERACAHLKKYEEVDVLANHQAMGLLALACGFKFLKIDFRQDEAYEKLWQRFLHSWNPEGWSLEYDGADIGYQTATLSFLGRLHRITDDSRLLPLIEPMLDFVQHGFFGDKSFAGSIGSRGTANLFHYGFEYWAHFFPLAETLAAHSRLMLQAGELLTPMDQEDHYLIYRIPEFLESYRDGADEVHRHGLLPCEQQQYSRYFHACGLFFKKTPAYYAAINVQRGGALKALLTDGRIVEDSGWVLKISKRAWLTTNRHCAHDKTLVDENAISIRGSASRFHQSLFHPWSFLAFRLFSLTFLRSPRLARWFKSWIRSRIMFHGKNSRSLQFHRRILLGDQLELRDELKGLSDFPSQQLWGGGAFLARSVPQSKYFNHHDLLNPPQLHQPSASTYQHQRTIS